MLLFNNSLLRLFDFRMYVDDDEGGDDEPEESFVWKDDKPDPDADPAPTDPKADPAPADPAPADPNADPAPADPAPADPNADPAPVSKKTGGKKKKTIDDRIKVLQNQTHETRELQRHVAQQQADVAERERKLAEKEAGTLIEPDSDDFDDTDAYKTALSDYYKKKSEIDSNKNTQQEVSKHKFAEKQKQIITKWKFKKERAVEEDPSFVGHERKVNETFEIFNTHPIVEQTLIDSEHATRLVSYLGQNSEELERVAQSSPGDAIKRLGMLEARLNVKPSSSSLAPDPITGSSGGGGASAGLEGKSFAEFSRRRNEQEAKR